MLIRIALCEDLLADQKNAEQCVQNWVKQTSHQISINTFPDSGKLLWEINDAFESFDLYLLDIEMKTKQEGLELARMIRKQSEHIPIVFITSHTELAFQSYDVHALHFISKPILEERLFSSLDKLVKILEQRNTHYFTCTIDGIMRRFPFYDIFYFKSDDHYIHINGDEKLRFRYTMDEIISEYPNNFAFIYRGYAVNIAHISTVFFSDQEILLTNGIKLAASKNYLTQLRRRFTDFHSII